MFKLLKPKSDFAHNVFTLMTGTTIAQVIPIAVSPILTRIYSPEDFGLFAVYIGIVVLCTVISSAKYDASIMLPQKDSRAFNLVIISLILTFIFSIVVLLIVFLFKIEMFELFDVHLLENWIYLIPVSVFFGGIYQVLLSWNNRKKNYKKMSNAILFQSASNAGFSIFWGGIGFHTLGLIFTNILGVFISIVVLFRTNFTAKVIKQFYHRKVIFKIMYQYRDFPIYTLPQNFIFQGTVQLPVFFIALIFSNTTLGLYALAYRIIAAPISIISSSLGSVFYQKAAEMYINDKVKLQKYIIVLMKKLLILSSTIGLIFIYFLPSIFEWTFGESWREAGRIAQLLSIYLIFNFSLSPFTGIYYIAKQNRYYLKWEIFRFIMLGCFFLIYYFFNLSNENQFFAIFSLLNLLLYLMISIPIVNKNSFLWRTV